MSATLGLVLPVEVVTVGAVTGLTYALLAAGIVLTYRASRVLNLAHAQVGALAAGVLVWLHVGHGWGYVPSLAVALAVGAALGGAVDRYVVRRLGGADRVTVLVATVGLAQLAAGGQLLLPDPDVPNRRFPAPFESTVEVGRLTLHGGHLAVLAAAPLVIGLATWFLTRTRAGIAVRAAADNRDAAALAGMDVPRISTMVWAAAGALAALTVALVNAAQGAPIGATGPVLGAGLLLRVLAAAVPGRFESLPLTIVGGVAIGVIEAVVEVNATSAGAADVAVLVVLLGTLLVTGRFRTLDGRMPAVLGGAREVRPRLGPSLRRTGAVGLVLAAGAVPWVVGSGAQLFSLSRVLLYALVAVSVTVLTGWAGQVSLGQFAFVGLGSMVAAALVDRGVGFEVAVGYAVVAGVAAALVVGVPALRARGVLLAVSSLGFAVAAWSWFLDRPVFTGGRGGAVLPRSSVFGIDLGSQRRYYLLCLAALAVVVVVVSRVGRSGVGRTLAAVRDDERRAAAFGISPAAAKLLAFGLSGGIAALGGALLAGLRVGFSVDDFAPAESLAVLSTVVIGGVGSVAGALVGTAYVLGLPALLGGSPEARFLTSGLGLVVVVLWVPGGLAGLAARLATRWLGSSADPVEAPASDAPEAADVGAPPGPVVAASARAGARPIPTTIGGAVGPLAEAERPVEEATPARTEARRTTSRPLGAGAGGAPLGGEAEAAPEALRLVGVTARRGGRTVLDDVALSVAPREVVGLIGSNGAGKSTLMDVVSGFVTPARGTVHVLGRDATWWPAHERAALGAGRVFQDARLFPTATVEEAILVALEGRERSELVPTALALPPARRAERAKRAEAQELIAAFGLGAHHRRLVAELSTGVRRVVELACLTAQRSRLLLLDEPTAGIAQREVEAFGPLIVDVARQLGAGVLLVEHDLPLVFALSDRAYCLAEGRVVAEGPPEAMATDPAVVDAYLGTSERALHRSRVGPGAHR